MWVDPYEPTSTRSYLRIGAPLSEPKARKKGTEPIWVSAVSNSAMDPTQGSGILAEIRWDATNEVPVAIHVIDPTNAIAIDVPAVNTGFTHATLE